MFFCYLENPTHVAGHARIMNYNYCASFIGDLFFNFSKVSTDEITSFEKKLPSLRTYWKQESPKLFNEFFNYFNQDFKINNKTAICFLGADIGYGSKTFLLLGLRSYLDSSDWKLNINREDAFITFVFHELLHIWIDNNISYNQSSILKKYHHEPREVKAHIHLMAIQKMIYLNINRMDILNTLDMCYSELQDNDYKRAWNIVNNIENHTKILLRCHLEVFL